MTDKNTETLAELHQEMLDEVGGFEQSIYDLYKEVKRMSEKIKEIGADSDEPHETYGNMHDQIQYIVSRALYDPGCWAMNALETYTSKLLEEQDNV